MSETRPPMTAGPIERAFRFLKSTSLNCGAPEEGAGVTEADNGGVVLAGDAAAGEKFFFGKGNCSGCHMVQGRGGAIGPDLTSLARQRRLGQIERKLRRPSLHRRRHAAASRR